MAIPSRESEIKDAVEREERFIQWFTDEVWRGKSWVKKLLFFDIVLFLAFTPTYATKVLHVFSLQPLPRWYPIAFWLVVSLVFLAAIIVAIHERSQKPEQRGRPEPGPIKGLLAFGFE